MKGILLAGGSGTRLFPVTKSVSKQLLPIYNKPMIYYPLSVLMLTGIRDILIISTPQDVNNYKRLLGSGENFGINLEYKIQERPEGIPQAFIIGEDFIGDDSVCLILGDNIFHGPKFSKILNEASKLEEGAIVFGYQVSDPQRFGVVEFDENNNVLSIEEKPKEPRSEYAVTGIYFYDNKVIEISKNLKPSERGELEITGVNNEYLKNGTLKVKHLGRGFAWLDTGTHDSLLEAGLFVKTIENRQGFRIACIEEIAYKKGWINKEKLLELIKINDKNDYGSYLKYLLK